LKRAAIPRPASALQIRAPYASWYKKTAPPPMVEVLFLAQREGFEPSCGCPQTDFESFMQL